MRVRTLQHVLRFATQRQIELIAGPTLVGIRDSLNGKLVSVNVPTPAPGEVPRVVIRSPDTVLALSLKQLQVTVMPPDHVAGDYAGALEFMKRRVEAIIHAFEKHKLDYRWSGLVADTEYPLPNQDVSAITAKLVDHMTRLDPAGRRVSAFMLNFGYVESRFNVSYTVAGYESKELSVEVKEPTLLGDLDLDFEGAAVREVGIEIKIDVNSRPGPTVDPITDMNQLIEQHVKVLARISDETRVGDLLHGT
jgi:hypothetical protein